MYDSLHKFMFDHVPVRGEIVSVQSAWQHILSLHHYPPAVANLLGEMLAAAALLSSTLKFDGSLVMQIYGDGPVKLLVAESNSELGLRATATLAPKLTPKGSGAPIADDASLTSLINQHGQARMVITLDPREKLPGQQPYQGIVPVEADTLAQVLQDYMRRSEQLETQLWLACDAGNASGMLLQRMPQAGGHSPAPAGSEEDWQHLLQLAATLKREELLQLPPQQVVTRLFWNEQARLFEARRTHFFCSCSPQRVANMLRTLGRPELESVVAEMGQVEVHCEYCNTRYAFDAVDVAQLFIPENATLIIPGRQH